jgi:hypothetical protein
MRFPISHLSRILSLVFLVYSCPVAIAQTSNSQDQNGSTSQNGQSGSFRQASVWVKPARKDTAVSQTPPTDPSTTQKQTTQSTTAQPVNLSIPLGNGQNSQAVAPVTVTPQSSNNPNYIPVLPQTTVIPNSADSSVQGLPPRELIEHVIVYDHGQLFLDKVKKAIDQPTKGVPDGSTLFENGEPGSGIDDVVNPNRGSQFFNQPVLPAVDAGPATPADYHQILGTFHEVPGGVVLQGVAEGLPEITQANYDANYNAFVLNGQWVYFPWIKKETLAVMCRALAEDSNELMGVSMGDILIVYGKVPKLSNLALDMAITDDFLGDIVFAARCEAKRDDGWTDAYVIPDGYQLEKGSQPPPGIAGSIVLFNFHGFRFTPANNEIRLAGEQLSVELFPLSAQRADDDGLLSDESALTEHPVCNEYQNNAKNIQDHISYYCRERIVRQVFTYAQVASVLRAMKQGGCNLKALADIIAPGTEAGTQ